MPTIVYPASQPAQLPLLSALDGVKETCLWWTCSAYVYSAELTISVMKKPRLLGQQKRASCLVH